MAPPARTMEAPGSRAAAAVRGPPRHEWRRAWRRSSPSPGWRCPSATTYRGQGREPPTTCGRRWSPHPGLPNRPACWLRTRSVYDGPVQPAFSARVVGANPIDLYWRLDVFDHFDGSQWTPTAAFRRAGTALPHPPTRTVPARAVTATVSLDTPAAYLPAPDRPVEVSVGGLDVSASDGILAVPVGRPPVSRYIVRSMVADPSRSDLLAAANPAGTTGTTDPGSPPFPQAVTTLASTLIASAPPSPFARLTAIADYLTRAPFALPFAGAVSDRQR